MLPIEYRAKKKNDDGTLGEFVYGYFSRYSSGMTGDVIETKDNDYPVDIRTLGIYTGYNDDKDNRIYTGDVLHCYSNSLRADLGNLVCTMDLGAFVLVSPEYAAEFYSLCSNTIKYKLPKTYPIWRFNKEVVGNIYGNIATAVDDENTNSETVEPTDTTETTEITEN